jgi:cytochrome c peroxidase
MKSGNSRTGLMMVKAAAGALVVAAGAYVAVAILPPVPVPAGNPITENKRVLGKMLFWDEQLSSHNTVSCGTCHSPATGGSEPRIARHPGQDGLLNTGDDIFGSPGVVKADGNLDYQRDALFGVNAQITERWAPTFINAAFAPVLFWDGRATGQFRDPVTNAVVLNANAALESQAVGPVLNSVEMAHPNYTWSEVTAKLARVNPMDLATNIPADVSAVLASRPTYSQLFQAAFGDGQITASRIAMAIATYQRTLISNQTPFDAFRAGNSNALTAAQQRGLNAFQAPGSRCNVCHNVNNELFTDQTFRNIGLRPPAEDLGRQVVTGNPNDRGRFRVPTLRNVGLRNRFMHNGQFNTLAQVINFYDNEGAPQFLDNQDPAIAGINIPEAAEVDIADFLANGLTDPRVRNQTFPFDRPALFTDRAGAAPSLVGGGVPGTGNVIPIMVAITPPMVGNLEFQLGVDRVPANATARLGLSAQPPVNGRIVPERYLDGVNANSTGTATVKWPLRPGTVSGGEVLFAQWFIVDSNAVGGQSLSQVVRIPFFCGSYGCPSVCPADFLTDGSVDGDDVIAFFADWDSGVPSADVNEDGSTDGDDVIYFFSRWDTGC